jgi:succinate dehydrogenase / fumarate reductase flavoprotein subunit/fumarate reductase (CoM/CoB) subunit A
MAGWDVIVIGSGAAGLAAARHARIQGAEVLVVNKGVVGRTGATITSGGGISASGESLARLGLSDADPGDRVQDFFEDIVRSGYFLCDQTLVAAIAEGIEEDLADLLALGIKPKVSRRPPGHSSGRGVLVPGPELQKGMTAGAVAAGVRFREDFVSAELLQSDSGVTGVVGLDRRTGDVEAIEAPAVVIATGGTTSNWALRTAPEELVGEGHAMALAAGAELINMEMLQFLPCCAIAPEMWKGIQIPWILGPQSGVRAWLLNRYGERFLARWDPQNMELATRDVVAAASAAEVLAGRGSPNGGVYLSWAHLPRDILDHMPSWSKSFSQDWRYQGFEVAPLIERIRDGHAIEVAPAAHFSLGGIRADAEGETGVAGLFACGEAVGGVHGGNRLSGNAGAQILVQGRRAGRAAARRAAQFKGARPETDWRAARDRIEAPLRRNDGLAPVELQRRLATISEDALAPIRDEVRLVKALDEIRTIRTDTLPRLAVRSHDRAHNRDWAEALACNASVCVVEAALLGGLARTSSLGAHQRSDGIPGSTLNHGLASLVSGEAVHRSEPVRFPFLSREAL